MKKIRFLMVGGFLGSGKTTTIAKLASYYTQQRLNVGLVTNDQAYNLVDTQTLRSQGFNVGEVPGACFCCKFDDLIGTVSELSESKLPDIVIAEPVGSCTDLYATVIQPMRELFGDRFELGPLIVLLKPEHGRKILGQSQGRRGFSPQAEYIFLKQLEEADAIAINKVDKLSDEQLDELLSAVASRYESTSCFGFSARDGKNFDQFVELASQTISHRKSTMEVDYETYAQGEAELGWLNCQVRATGDSKFALDELVLKLTQTIGRELSNAKCETAHLKIMGQTLENAAVANLVSSTVDAELSLASEVNVVAAELLVNARVAAEPDLLVQIVQDVCREIGAAESIDLEFGNVQSFRPSKPEPTHRMNVE